MSIQQEILRILEGTKAPVLFDDILEELKRRHPDSLTFDLRSAILPLLSTGQVYFTKADRTTLALYEP